MPPDPGIVPNRRFVSTSPMVLKKLLFFIEIGPGSHLGLLPRLCCGPARPTGTEDSSYIFKFPIKRKADVMLIFKVQSGHLRCGGLGWERVR